MIGTHWVRLRSDPSSITAETAKPVADWDWLTHYLQLDLDLSEVVRSFPDDEPMRAAVAACRGLRLLRQDPWECLASFILSSTKQIVQIRQITSLLCERYGEPLAVAPGWPAAFAFPSPARLARVTEAELRACKMGFRAPYLLATARLIAGGQLDLARLHALPVEAARERVAGLAGRRAEDRRLRLALRLRVPVGLPGGRLGDEGAAAALFSPAASPPPTPAAVRGHAFRPPRRLRAAVSVSSHPDACRHLMRHARTALGISIKKSNGLVGGRARRSKQAEHQAKHPDGCRTQGRS